MDNTHTDPTNKAQKTLNMLKRAFLTARLAAPEVADRDLAESVLLSGYLGREDDLDIEYPLCF